MNPIFCKCILGVGIGLTFVCLKLSVVVLNFPGEFRSAVTQHNNGPDDVGLRYQPLVYNKQTQFQVSTMNI